MRNDGDNRPKREFISKRCTTEHLFRWKDVGGINGVAGDLTGWQEQILILNSYAFTDMETALLNM